MGLRAKFTLLLAILACLFLAYVHFWVAPQMSNRALVIEENAHRAQLSLTAEAIIPPLLENDLAKVYELLDAIRYDNPSWVELQLFSSEGGRLYPLMKPSVVDGHFPQLYLEQAVGFLQPPIARLQLAVDMTESRQAAIQFETSLWTALLPFMVFLLAVIWLKVEWIIRRPIEQMVRASRQLVRGSFDHPVPSHKRDELGELARAFDDMRASIERHHINIAEELDQQRKRALLLEQEKQLAEFDAIHDALTGLLNRRELERQVKIALDEVQSQHWKQHVLLYIDLDHFKAVNDNCGHQAGDQLLCDISRVMRERIREKDLLARVGGDEFAILLKDCPLEVGVRIANDICSAVHDYRYVCEKGSYQVGSSIGVAPVLPENASLEHMIAVVDSACYAAKRRGRNRVEVAVGEVLKKSDQVA
ncbi:diguanylate cyclase [Marinobacterium sediminicola]|uniref:diguanylate cyclase n=1 Tax=Marinobacterium sediminicola TaxID=518898 RepID=A0ABY1RYW4_9GAMM|nr:diguanylate cyclase [Marinobacterium sediminicola]ULG68052.1 diguanylate cyclase [Marinobacterium sediminicola]SMR73438.1 diguanylate cyclase (GGDEF) domain-containing protein [Marinobacterium sediminicola]